jgi:hypothetical protein
MGSYILLSKPTPSSGAFILLRVFVWVIIDFRHHLARSRIIAYCLGLKALGFNGVITGPMSASPARLAFSTGTSTSRSSLSVSIKGQQMDQSIRIISGR